MSWKDWLLGAAAATLIAAPAAAQSLRVQGPDGRAISLTAAEIAALPRVAFRFTGHGRSATFEGPLLADVLAKAGAPAGKALRGPALAHAVLVTAADGYQVVFGLAETDPGTRQNRIILADRADGKPLNAEDGPFRIVAEGDLRPARGARKVAEIAVFRLGAPANAGAGEHRH